MLTLPHPGRNNPASAGAGARNQAPPARANVNRGNNNANKAPAKEYPGRPPKVERPVKNEDPKFDGGGKLHF